MDPNTEKFFGFPQPPRGFMHIDDVFKYYSDMSEFDLVGKANSIKWEGYVYVAEAGSYSWQLYSSDSEHHLWIDGEELLDYSGSTGWHNSAYTFANTGWHKIRIQVFNASISNNNSLKLYHQLQGGSTTLVPANCLTIDPETCEYETMDINLVGSNEGGSLESYNSSDGTNLPANVHDGDSSTYWRSEDNPTLK